jgi:hypothetical protein
MLLDYYLLQFPDKRGMPDKRDMVVVPDMLDKRGMLVVPDNFGWVSSLKDTLQLR